jgi:GDP-mannose 6-dehydrogenase
LGIGYCDDFCDGSLDVNISIFGLGYVGSVSAACLAALGQQVVGVDVSALKVDLINAGQSPVIEPGLEALITEMVRLGRLSATTCAKDALATSDMSIICVGTPSNHNGDLDLRYVERVCEDIGKALAHKPAYHTVVIRSTVLPRTTETRLIPILEQTSGKQAGVDFGVAYHPEFLREGTALHDFHHPPYTIIGQSEPRSAQAVARLYDPIEAPLRTVPLRVAEMVKYSSNAFHALKVTFANEIGNICKQSGIDSHHVMEVFCLDEKLNLSAYYLKPGFAFGGSCLPKDLRALLYHANRMDVEAPVLQAVLPSNELQIKHGFELVRRTGLKKIGVLGFSFKAGTDDLRESPLVELIEMLLGKGHQVKIFDRNVTLARLTGANRAYIEREIPHIATLMCGSIDEVLSESEVIVIGNNAAEFREAVAQTRADQIVIDLVRVAQSTEHIAAQYEGICW